MNILLTGGVGFIGFNLAKELLKRGDKLLIVDNFNDYYDINLKRKRFEILKNLSDNFELFEIDLACYQDLEEIFKNYKIDKICNLAAQAGVRHSLSHPFDYINTNIVGFVNLLELCRHYNVKDIVFASSSSVYGNNKELPFTEEHKVDTPISLYAASKKANEEKAFTYHHLFGLNCTGLRFFTVYGPWGRPDMALFLFTKAILEGKPIKVFNNGQMVRDFTYIDDIVSGVIGALDNPYPYEIFNLARGEAVQLMDYIEEIKKNLGVEAKKIMMPLQPGDVPKTTAVIDKAKEKLGYNPQIFVETGIRNFIEWYRGYYEV